MPPWASLPSDFPIRLRITHLSDANTPVSVICLTRCIGQDGPQIGEVRLGGKEPQQLAHRASTRNNCEQS